MIIIRNKQQALDHAVRLLGRNAAVQIRRNAHDRNERYAVGVALGDIAYIVYGVGANWTAAMEATKRSPFLSPRQLKAE